MHYKRDNTPKIQRANRRAGIPTVTMRRDPQTKEVIYEAAITFNRVHGSIPTVVSGKNEKLVRAVATAICNYSDRRPHLNLIQLREKAVAYAVEMGLETR